jgi:hypothetical protein
MTELVVSCPSCGEENTVAMEIENGLSREMENLYSFISPDLKRYSFNGSTKCPCGKLVIATLTVAG